MLIKNNRTRASANRPPRSQPKTAEDVSLRDLYTQTERNGDKPYRDAPGLGSILGSIIAHGHGGRARSGPPMTRFERSLRRQGVNRSANAGVAMERLKKKRLKEIGLGTAGATAGVAGLAGFATAAKLGAGENILIAVGMTAVAGLAGFAVAKRQFSNAGETQQVVKNTQKLTTQILD